MQGTEAQPASPSDNSAEEKSSPVTPRGIANGPTSSSSPSAVPIQASPFVRSPLKSSSVKEMVGMIGNNIHLGPAPAFPRKLTPSTDSNPPLLKAPPRPAATLSRSAPSSPEVPPRERGSGSSIELGSHSTPMSKIPSVVPKSPRSEIRKGELVGSAPTPPSCEDNEEKESLEQLKKWREEERLKAIEREKEKRKKKVNLEELNLRPDVAVEKEEKKKGPKKEKKPEQEEGAFWVKAVGDYKEKGKNKLNFKTGQVIKVTQVNENEGLWFGVFGKKSGWFPNYYASVVQNE